MHTELPRPRRYMQQSATAHTQTQPPTTSQPGPSTVVSTHQTQPKVTVPPKSALTAPATASSHKRPVSPQSPDRDDANPTPRHVNVARKSVQQRKRMRRTDPQGEAPAAASSSSSRPQNLSAPPKRRVGPTTSRTVPKPWMRKSPDHSRDPPASSSKKTQKPSSAGSTSSSSLPSVTAVVQKIQRKRTAPKKPTIPAAGRISQEGKRKTACKSHGSDDVCVLIL